MTEPDFLRSAFDQLASEELPVPQADRVVRRGRQRRRHARGKLAAAAAAAVILAIGTGQLIVLATQPRPVATGQARSGLCTAAPDAALAAALARPAAPSQTGAIQPIAVNQDGTAVYVYTDSSSFRGIAEENATTGSIITRIQSLPSGPYEAVGESVAGGRLIWADLAATRAGAANSWHPVYLWSPQHGITALEPAGQHGNALSGPVVDNQKLAAWAEADGRMQEIVEANLGTGVTEIISRGYVGAPIFIGSVLVWPVASSSNRATSQLVARYSASFPAMKPAAVPVQLRAAGSASLIGSNGMATAYISPDLRQLFYSPSPSAPARLMLRLPAGTTFAADDPLVGYGYLGWTTSSASYLASPATLAAARVTAGGALAWAADYVFVIAPPSASTGPAGVWYLVRGSVIAGLRCAAPARHPGARG